MAQFEQFKPSLLTFLRQLGKNNNREWFAENKSRYEALVREPALDFISAMGPPLGKIAPYFVAVPKKTGGSLMRVYRDTRFSKDKTPYKTNVGIQFRHERSKDAHTPGYYFHIDPESVFIGAGDWRPESKMLQKIRQAIDERPAQFKKAIGGSAFKRNYALSGDSLVRPPRGYDKDHPMIDHLKRKDFIAVRNLPHSILYEPKLIAEVARTFKAATPLMQFLCQATGAKF